MSKSEIIKDGAALNTRITSTLKTYATAADRIHVEVISALWHVASHGNPFYLNRIFAALRDNDKAAVRLFIRRAHAIIGLEGDNPDGKPAEVVQAAIEQGTVVKLTRDEFSVVNGHNSKQAQFLVKLCEERFIDPDNENDFKVLVRNNFTEVRTLGDGQVLDNLIRLAKSIDTETDTRKVKVSDHVKKFLKEIQDKAEVFKSQGALAEG